MRRNLLIGLAVLVALVASVAAISANKKTDQAGQPQVALAEPADGQTAGETSDGEPGSTIAPFSARDVDGRRVQVGAGKPGALFFFAGWCGPCQIEARALGRVQAEFGSRVAITAVSPDPSDSVAAIRLFRRNSGGPSYPFVWDSAGALGRQYAVRALDTTIVFDKAGNVVFRDAAVTDVDTLRAAFRKAGVR